MTTTFQQMPGLGAVEEGAAAGERHGPVRHAVHRSPGTATQDKSETPRCMGSVGQARNS